MDNLYICPVGGLCDFIPGNWLWTMSLVMATLYFMWIILAFVPLTNIIGLWAFAFTRSPNLDR